MTWRFPGQLGLGGQAKGQELQVAWRLPGQLGHPGLGGQLGLGGQASGLELPADHQCPLLEIMSKHSEVFRKEQVE